jgi:hypothetical protein
VQRYGAQSVLEACSDNPKLAGIDATRVSEVVDQLTIPEFAALKQRIAEAKAKRWHQVERWNEVKHE